ncbi:hypothetical protein L9F63_013024, partial [Diploptera punctata]
ILVVIIAQKVDIFEDVWNYIIFVRAKTTEKNELMDIMPKMRSYFIVPKVIHQNIVIWTHNKINYYEICKKHHEHNIVMK